jgi:hypothetical protein
MIVLKTMKEQFLNSSFQVSKYLTFSKDAGASKTTFKIGKNLFKACYTGLETKDKRF